MSPTARSLTGILLIPLVLTACATGQNPSASASPSGAAPASPTSVEPSPSMEPSPPAEPSQESGGDALEGRMTAELAIAGGPDWPTEAFGAIWILAPDGEPPAVIRVDPATNEEVARIELPSGGCQGIGASPDAIWACTPDGILRIDPETDTIVAEVEYDSPAMFGRLAFGAGTVWGYSTTDVVPDAIVRVDPATNATTATIPLPGVAGGMAFGFDALWVTVPAQNTVLRIDPATNEVTPLATDVEGAQMVAVGSDALWVSLHGSKEARPGPDEPTLARIDPTDGTIVARIATGGSVVGGDVAASADSVWVRAPQPFLVQIDPDTNEVVDRIEERASEGSLLVTEDAVWVTSVSYGRLWRIDGA
jgi:virginiamycin B lyase